MKVSNIPVINVTIKQHLEEICQNILGPNIKVSNSLVINAVICIAVSGKNVLYQPMFNVSTPYIIPEMFEHCDQAYDDS